MFRHVFPGGPSEGLELGMATPGYLLTMKVTCPNAAERRAATPDPQIPRAALRLGRDVSGTADALGKIPR